MIKWYDKDIMDSTRFNTSRLFQIWFVLLLHYIILLYFIILRFISISVIEMFSSEVHSIRYLNSHGSWNRNVHGLPTFLNDFQEMHELSKQALSGFRQKGTRISTVFETGMYMNFQCFYMMFRSIHLLKSDYFHRFAIIRKTHLRTHAHFTKTPPVAIGPDRSP